MITWHDLFLVAFLAFLESILSIDNALVLAMLARNLPREKQRKALTYGLGGAIVFRLGSLFLITWLLRYAWVKFAGGAYLVFIALKHLFFGEAHQDIKAPKRGEFWRVVLLIEVMDIAFAVDSILAAVALTSKFWVIFAGGMLGVVAMRYAATLFIRVLEHFPSFETSAFLMVLLIGLKVIIEGLPLPGVAFDGPGAAGFWVFWLLILACILSGFRRKPTPKPRRRA